jgi:hypothetical protein
LESSENWTSPALWLGVCLCHVSSSLLVESWSRARIELIFSGTATATPRARPSRNPMHRTRATARDILQNAAGRGSLPSPRIFANYSLSSLLLAFSVSSTL